ncbi:hypothetical protein [Pseudonocardia sp.]|jgi:hypothetical protein|uniref:hypothetical protein n=1 Tax=Pseudonocardia sp. TaxID=60912 RepID=UPI003D13208B
MTTSAPVATAAGSVETEGAVVVTDSGIRVGVADGHGQVRDFSGVRIGAVAPGHDGAVVDFAGVRIGHVVRGSR